METVNKIVVFKFADERLKLTKGEPMPDNFMGIVIQGLRDKTAPIIQYGSPEDDFLSEKQNSFYVGIVLSILISPDLQDNEDEIYQEAISDLLSCEGVTLFADSEYCQLITCSPVDI